MRLWEIQAKSYVELSYAASHAIVWSLQPGDDPKPQASELAGKIFAHLATTRIVGHQKVVDAARALVGALIEVETAAEKKPEELEAALASVRPTAANLLQELRDATGAPGDTDGSPVDSW